MNVLTARIAPLMLRVGRAIHRRSPSYRSANYDRESCPVCGVSGSLILHGVLWPALVLQWKLTPAWANWIDQREGLKCSACHSNLRSRHLAKTIVEQMNARLGTASKTLVELCNDPICQAQMIAEINSAGNLHSFLNQAKGLRYSEYGSLDPNIPSEDLLNLTYADASFDLVVNSDVLEHVPDVERALSEIYRILKPGGLYIFTVPVVWVQPKTRQRAEIRHGQLEHKLSPSYHGSELEGKSDFLVFYEFGRDFTQTCENVGFAVRVEKDARNPAVATFVAERTL